MRSQTHFLGFLFLSFFLTFTSCISKREVLYLQDYQQLNGLNTNDYTTVIRPDDILYIKVSSLNESAAAPYNAPTSENSRGTQNFEVTQGYLVDKEGYVQLPEIGAIKLGGLSKSQATDFLLDKLKIGLKDPVVNLRILNYKVTILGEVRSPGTYTINSERVSVLDAIGLAGDLTMYGKRNVKVIRNTNGEYVVGELDLTSHDFAKSDFFYLQQNDVVIVDPRNSRIQSAAVGSNAGVFISVTSVLISLIVLFTRL